jgi:hypothetical protein
MDNSVRHYVHITNILGVRRYFGLTFLHVLLLNQLQLDEVDETSKIYLFNRSEEKAYAFCAKTKKYCLLLKMLAFTQNIE